MVRSLFVLACVILCASPVSSQVEIILEEPCPTLNGGMVPHYLFQQRVTLHNPTDTVRQLCAVFSLSTSRDIGFGSIPEAQFSNGVDTLFSNAVLQLLDLDTAYLVIVWLSSPTQWNGGIMPGEYPLEVCKISVSFSGPGWPLPEVQVWIDSAQHDDQWYYWRYNTDQTLTFTGLANYQVYWVPNMPAIIFESWGEHLSVPGPGCKVTRAFVAERTIPYDNEGMEFAVLVGPGQIDSILDLHFSWVVYWSFVPTTDDADQTLDMRIGCRMIGCQGTWLSGWYYPDEYTRIQVGPLDVPPQFVSGQQTKFVARIDEPLVISFVVDDPDPESNSYYYFAHWQDPDPPATIDPQSGVFTFLGGIEDTATYYIYEVVEGTCGTVADTIGFFVYLYESVICGDANHSYQVDLSDLMWLVNYLFRGGVEPVPMLAGDVTCDEGVDLSDLIYLVNYLFMGGPAPCAACP